jgi:hypothetical protein
MTDKKLTKKEQDELLVKIRDEYRKYASEYNDKAFDLDAFNKRYTHVFVNRMNMEAFLLSEVAFLEELKDKLEKSILKKQEIETSLNKISQELLRRWQKYNEIRFHSLADMEIRFFYGALTQFCELYIPIIRKYLNGKPELTDLTQLFRNVERIGLPIENKESIRIQIHSDIIDNKREDAEKDKQHLLREGAQALNTFTNKFEKIIHNLPGPELQEKFNSDNLYLSSEPIKEKYLEHYEELVNKTLLQVYQEIIGFTIDVIDDFRLAPFIKGIKNI